MQTSKFRRQRGSRRKQSTEARLQSFHPFVGSIVPNQISRPALTDAEAVEANQPLPSHVTFAAKHFSERSYARMLKQGNWAERILRIAAFISCYSVMGQSYSLPLRPSQVVWDPRGNAFGAGGDPLAYLLNRVISHLIVRSRTLFMSRGCPC
jgi:hypothetical protein